MPSRAQSNDWLPDRIDRSPQTGGSLDRGALAAFPEGLTEPERSLYTNPLRIEIATLTLHLAAEALSRMTGDPLSHAPLRLEARRDHRPMNVTNPFLERLGRRAPAERHAAMDPTGLWRSVKAHLDISLHAAAPFLAAARASSSRNSAASSKASVRAMWRARLSLPGALKSSFCIVTIACRKRFASEPASAPEA
ncbi:hypothetical protein ACVIGB_001109 [Bradyrhizobium sp. USDA 4341]